MSLCRPPAPAKATSMQACGGAALRAVSVNGVLVLVTEQNVRSANQGDASTARAAACKQATA
ncbi:hypothetical protein CFBP6773_00483 [Xanthomonas arboricola pv. fragariae]|nr:hypothetical protein CFBP6773_00483 [Xanthomonas arboricola pv. fragariae]